MKNILFLLLFLCCYTAQLTAQREFEYINPPSIQHQDYTIDIDNIISKEDYCKFRLTIYNNTEYYQAFDLSKVGFIYENIGTYYPKKGTIKIIPPDEKISHTIRIDGNMNYMVEQFQVALEGLFYASAGTPVEVAARSLEAGKAIDSKQLEVEIKKVNNKKGRFSFAMNGQYKGGKKEFVTIDPTELKATDAEQQSIDAKVGNKKRLVLQNGKKFNINGDFESNSSSLQLDWTDVITSYTLTAQPKTVVSIYHTAPVSTPAVTSTTTTTTTQTVQTVETASNTPTPTPTPTPRPAAKNNCAPHVAPLGGQPVKITIFSEEGECFQVRALGQYVNPNYASRVTFGFPIVGKVAITMENGATFDKSILLNNDIYEVTYKIKKNKKGKYVTKMLLGTVGSTGPTAQELAEQSAANLEKFKREQEAKSNAQLEDHRRRIAALDAKTETKTETYSNNNSNNSSYSSSSSHSTTSSSISNNNRSSSSKRMSGQMHLRFMEGSTPLTNMRVEVSTLSGWTGSGVTDSNGDVYIDATNLNTKNINIYAKNSRAEYKLANIVKLDDNLFALIEPATLLLNTTNKMINAAESGDTDAILEDMGW